MTRASRELAAEALTMARTQPQARAAWRCVAVALRETTTIAGARAALAEVGIIPVRDRALELLGQLTGQETVR